MLRFENRTDTAFNDLRRYDIKATFLEYLLSHRELEKLFNLQFNTCIVRPKTNSQSVISHTEYVSLFIYQLTAKDNVKSGIISMEDKFQIHGKDIYAVTFKFQLINLPFHRAREVMF